MKAPSVLNPDADFAFGTHPQHGYVASFASTFPAHLADWYLTRLQFESLPEEPSLYRLADPERDGARRTRQAAQDLRAHHYSVHLDAHVAHPPATPPTPLPHTPAERRSRIAKAAGSRTTLRGTVPTTSAPASRPLPPKPTYAPTVHLRTVRGGRSR